MEKHNDDDKDELSIGNQMVLSVMLVWMEGEPMITATIMALMMTAQWSWWQNELWQISIINWTIALCLCVCVSVCHDFISYALQYTSYVLQSYVLQSYVLQSYVLQHTYARYCYCTSMHNRNENRPKRTFVCLQCCIGPNASFTVVQYCTSMHNQNENRPKRTFVRLQYCIGPNTSFTVVRYTHK